MKVYGDIRSGNCYKLKLLASLLSIDHEWVHVDIMAGGTRAPEFLAMNPNGKIPVLELDDGRYLSESNAILNYLAADTELLPQDNFEKAKVFQWQFFEQYSHEPYLAVARFIAKYLGLPDDSRDFGDAASLLKHFVSGKPFRLLTNNPKKVHDLNAFGLADITPVKHVCGVGDNNRRYLQAKRNWGHEIDSDDL